MGLFAKLICLLGLHKRYLTVDDPEFSDLVWPNEPLISSMCLHCGIIKRRRHSWFCRVECEDRYLQIQRSCVTELTSKGVKKG